MRAMFERAASPADALARMEDTKGLTVMTYYM